MQNDDNQCNISLLQIICSAHRYLFPFGNYAANDLVTEQPQYSTHFCFLSTWQNAEILLILNRLRLSHSSFLSLALPCIFHIARHTFACIAIANKVSMESIAKMLGHSDIRTTKIYAKLMDRTVAEEMNVLKRKFSAV